MKMTLQSPGTGLLLADNQTAELGAMCHQVLWKLLNEGLKISSFLPSVFLNSLWMEIYSKSDLSMPDGLELARLSSHLPGSHRWEALVWIRQKAHCPWKKGQWACHPSKTRPSDCCYSGDGNSFLDQSYGEFFVLFCIHTMTFLCKEGTYHSIIVY